MFVTYTLGHVLGVPVRVHGLLLVLLAALLVAGAWQGQPVVLPVASVVVALLAHELGHALAARRLGVHVVEVVLGPVVSRAHLVGLPEHAGTEARIAAAGPAANLALAAVGAGALAALFGPAALALDGELGWRGPAAQLRVFVAVNLLFGLVNLVPAFPMDGGRLLRAALAGSGKSWLDATEIAVRVGRWLALGLLALGFVRSFVFLFIALFVLVAGARELLTVRLRHGAPLFRGAPFRGPTSRDADAGDADRGAEPADGAPGSPWAEAGPAPGSEPEPRPGGGFSDEDVRRLEAYRGRLRRGLEEL